MLQACTLAAAVWEVVCHMAMVHNSLDILTAARSSSVLIMAALLMASLSQCCKATKKCGSSRSCP